MNPPPDAMEFIEPGFHSLARAPRDSRPTIEIEPEGGTPFMFTLEFGAGAGSPERVVMKAEAHGTYRVPSVIHADELLFARAMIPVGHSVKIIVRWNPVES